MFSFMSGQTRLLHQRRVSIDAHECGNHHTSEENNTMLINNKADLRVEKKVSEIEF